ncbi:phosphatidylglycerophosphatase A-like protein [Paenibacillus larvae subsp. larvae]|uniref:Phosphatidylglycerophosphatase A-like protein n=1 Tax=Paenibacillus larvae subsp. larvae TaxID=147375 RepID=A0A2L1U2P9_9BACL|nr:hypothetical protein B1222_04560 [Paenibacillus larvae subsp. pulvifaciens]AQZ45270.1 hypothetical protein B5S25_00390 [Paenibacillus larvae subsp. pulvifaciens]AVF27215.1 phosphatidylglycerophosphatase A-like protein [Paenibacillus larvae subsp. larvae]AVF31878.1 phosphatidylglycerophosphatase A-like protein [Paenibacillus larvae subsp. larvae]
MKRRVHGVEIQKAVLGLLQQIAEIVYAMQSPFYPDISMEACLSSVNAVLEKRELQHALLVGIELDRLAEQKLLS